MGKGIISVRNTKDYNIMFDNAFQIKTNAVVTIHEKLVTPDVWQLVNASIGIDLELVDTVAVEQSVSKKTESSKKTENLKVKLSSGDDFEIGDTKDYSVQIESHVEPTILADESDAESEKPKRGRKKSN